MHKTLLSILLYVSFGAAGCGGHGHAHDEEPHAHVAPRGGLLIECGDHVGNVELLLDAADGELALYLLDGHAENPVRTTAQSIEVEVRAGDQTFTVQAAAQAKMTTGESVGDTSEFSVQDERLKGLTEFSGTLKAVEMYDERFEDLTFDYSSEDHGGE